MKPKILVDGLAFDNYFEGMRTYLENLYKIIDQIGDFEIFIASETDNAAEIFKNSNNVKFVKYEKTSKAKRLFRGVPAIISKYKIDASHFQYVVPPVKTNMQVVTIHDILFKYFPQEFTLRYRIMKGLTFYFSVKRADLVTTVSQYSKNALIEYFNLKEKDVHIISNGVNDAYFQSYDKNSAQKQILQKFGVQDFILYVSRIEPRKNHVDLLKAYLNLQLYNQGISLVLIGKRDLPVPDLDGVLANLPEVVAKNIYFFNNIDNQDLMLFYQAAKVFVYPSKAEGFGIPPLEAAALGTPTICANTTAMSEFTFFGENHIHPDTASIEKALQQLIESPMAENELNTIKNSIAQQYSWETAATKLNTLIINKLKNGR